MGKFIAAAVACCSLALPATALAEAVYVGEPTGLFSGSYATGQVDDPATPEDESTGYQEGYVRASTEADAGPELQVCNGSEANGLGTGYAYLSPTGSGPADPDTAGNEFAGVDEHQQGETEVGDPCPN